MMIQVFKSKIHRVAVTEANLNYVGSITIDEALMEAANMIEGERVQIVNNNNGERLETKLDLGEAITVIGDSFVCSKHELTAYKTISYGCPPCVIVQA